MLLERVLVDVVLAARLADELGPVDSSEMRSQCRWRGVARVAPVADDVLGRLQVRVEAGARRAAGRWATGGSWKTAKSYAWRFPGRKFGYLVEAETLKDIAKSMMSRHSGKARSSRHVGRSRQVDGGTHMAIERTLIFKLAVTGLTTEPGGRWLVCGIVAGHGVMLIQLQLVREARITCFADECGSMPWRLQVVCESTGAAECSLARGTEGWRGRLGHRCVARFS